MNEAQKEAICKLADLVELLSAMLYHELGELRHNEICKQVKEVKAVMNE